jgi:hypothetical protein
MRSLFLSCALPLFLLGVVVSAAQATRIPEVSDEISATVVGGTNYCEDYGENPNQYTCGGWGYGLKFWEFCAQKPYYYSKGQDDYSVWCVPYYECLSTCGYACGSCTTLGACYVD